MNNPIIKIILTLFTFLVATVVYTVNREIGTVPWIQTILYSIPITLMIMLWSKKYNNIAWKLVVTYLGLVIFALVTLAIINPPIR